MSAIAAALILSAWSQAADAQATGQPAPLPQRLSATGLYVEGSSTRDRSEESRVLAPVSSLVGWDAQTALDLSAARRSDRCIARGRVGIPARHATVERVLARSPGRDTLHRAAPGWRLAIRHVYLGCGRYGRDACLPAMALRRCRCRVRRTVVTPSPREADCRACHEGAAVPVLGFSALQLSSDRDPLAPHADARTDIDLPGSRFARTHQESPAGAHQQAAAHRGELTRRTRGAWVSAWQLRALPQRQRRAGACRSHARAERDFGRRRRRTRAALDD